MIFIDRKTTFKVIVTSMLYFFMFASTVYCLLIRGTAMQRSYIFNEGVDLLGMLFGYVLFVCCLIDVQKTGNDYIYFFYLLNIAYWGLFLDANAWMVDGIVGLKSLNYIINTLYYMASPMASCFFWLYVTRYIKMKGRAITILDYIVRFGLVAALVVRIINLFVCVFLNSKGFYFYIDSAGKYVRGDLYIVSLIYSYFAMLATLFAAIKKRKHLETYQLVSILLYVVVPLIATTISSKFYGVSIIYGVVMVVMLYMYCVLNVSQGREKVVADRELTLASHIQEEILPSTFPFPTMRTEFDIYASMTPAKEVGGDFYDFFMVDDDHVALVIADVSGKGIPAALFMMVARTLIKNQTLYNKELEPTEIFNKVNEQLCENNGLNLFVTAWLGILKISTGELKYANAGHEYPAFSRNDGKFVILKEKHSPPLATMEGIQFRGNQVVMKPGDCIYVYTDGVTEASNFKKELFGIDRMLGSLNRSVGLSTKEIDQNIRNDIKTFTRDEAQFDDITMLCMRYYG